MWAISSRLAQASNEGLLKVDTVTVTQSRLCHAKTSRSDWTSSFFQIPLLQVKTVTSKYHKQPANPPS